MPIATSTSPSDVLGRVSCTTATTCMAIGVSAGNAAGDELNAVPITRRHDGSTWVTEPPDTHPTDQVSCGSPTSCMTALGAFNNAITRHWNGTTWQTLADGLELSILGVTGLSCPTATWCILTTSNFGSGEANLNWVWIGGTTWTSVAGAPPESGSSRAVSCSAPGQCVVLTSWIDPAALSAVRLHVDGRCRSPASTSRNSASSPTSTAPPPASAWSWCRKDYGADDRPIGLLGVLRNGTWTSTVRPGSMFSDVDCWSAGGCVAVGAMSWLSTQSSIETYTGSGWRPVESPPGPQLAAQTRLAGCRRRAPSPVASSTTRAAPVVSRLQIDG